MHCIDKAQLFHYYKGKGDEVMATTNVTIRMDSVLKQEAEALFSDLGLNMTTAFVAFAKQAVREQRIPFMLSREIPNEETRQAIEEIEKLKKNPHKKSYGSFQELLDDVR